MSFQTCKSSEYSICHQTCNLAKKTKTTTLFNNSFVNKLVFLNSTFVKQKGCMRDLPSSAEKYDCDERLYDLNLPALVKFNYTAEREDELSLEKGTRVLHHLQERIVPF
uniref:Uncharacterized protein n=1 Tax=Cyprinus carpio TaxID=7962 RepID=A0A8C1SPD4_CYPCA